MDHCQRWKDLRRVFHRFFNQAKVYQFRPVMEEEMTVLLGHLAGEPARFRHWVRMYVSHSLQIEGGADYGHPGTLGQSSCAQHTDQKTLYTTKV
jgi:hypothetical protein